MVTAETDQDRDGVRSSHEAGTEHSAHPEVYLPTDEREAAVFWDVGDPTGSDVDRRMKVWRDADLWSQPSDRAVILAALLHRVGFDRIEPLLFD